MITVERLEADRDAALKAGDATTAGTLRMILSDLKYEEMKKGKPLEEADLLVVLQRGVKTRSESVEQYVRGGREDLAAKERAEIDVLRRYLPEPLSAEEVERRVADVIREVGATSKRDIGKVMKEATARLRGQTDGKTIQQAAQKLLP
jgi:uncharacterized protein YqeY